ncbi:DUF4232 domain-containing protein [Streptomyces sp. NPDC046909]|uniref:DUF4232 domain-containing protein n=1 Tax=Streptomyces sp. NPDC046909 TaxID=3155617 RepID=UPI0033F04FA6
MSTRTFRRRMLVAAALTAATLTLTACNDGQGVKDEGASAVASGTQSPDTSATPSSKASGTSGGSGTSGSTGGSTGTSGSSGSSGTSGSSGKGSKDSASDSDADSDSSLTPCTVSATRTTATEVSRPLNHMLLTVTNTGSKNCDLAYYPAVRFGEAQSVPPVFEDSQPQAVVTLAPGESGYASVLLSMADGSGSNGHTVKSLEVYFNTDATRAAKPSLPAKGVYVDDSIQVSYWQSTMADALEW